MKVAGCGLRFRNPFGAISSTHPHGKSFPLIYVGITKISMYINAVKVDFCYRCVLILFSWIYFQNLKLYVPIRSGFFIFIA